ncbi:MAG TPA: DJ-1/PfpI family protein [Trebonia sp.]|jgi:transcriptional regulator GlxA family with amidase domain
MQIVIALFDRFTALDAVGPHQVLHHLPGSEVVFAAERAGGVTDDTRTLTLQAQASYADVPRPDIIVIPGGPGQAVQMTPGPLPDWLLEADKTSTWTTSVCTGSLILAGAGLLTGRKATTNWQAHEALRRLGAIAQRERYVFDGKYVTAAGVSAGIDMALALAGRLAGDEEAERIQLAIEYDPQPPYQSGSPATARPEIVALLTAASRFADRAEPSRPR